MARLFDIPIGAVRELVVVDFHCFRCGAHEEQVRFTAIATESYIVHGEALPDGTPHVLRAWRFIHNPVCDCTDLIWVVDGPVVMR